jgi:TetR/AcrR family transcriptional regulator, regulator of cefoperazone and chloramphenicol sensitivity
MRLRKDGVETRERLLKVACEVFSKKGYRDATVAEICRAADTNIAAVNYHFRNKENFYLETWRYACREAMKLYPMTGEVPVDAPVEKRFQGHILSLLKRMTDDNLLRYWHRIFMMELTNPTGLIDDEIQKTHKAMQVYLRDLIREILGTDVNDEVLALCEMSVINQCRGVVHLKRSDIARHRSHIVHRLDVKAIAEHITTFCIAGFRGMPKEM